MHNSSVAIKVFLYDAIQTCETLKGHKNVNSSFGAEYVSYLCYLCTAVTLAVIWDGSDAAGMKHYHSLVVWGDLFHA